MDHISERAAETFSKLPAKSREDKLEFVDRIKSLRKTSPYLASRVLAEWINRHEVPRKGLNLTNDKIASPWLQCLNLKFLRYSQSQFERLIARCPNITKLNIGYTGGSYNPGEYTPINVLSVNVKLCEKLKFLDCSSSWVGVLPPEYVNLEELICNDNYNMITQLPPEYVNLKSLSCKGTRISVLPAQYTKLEYLRCDLGQFTQEELNKLPKTCKVVYE